jgi:hypothetical protein
VLGKQLAKARNVLLSFQFMSRGHCPTLGARKILGAGFGRLTRKRLVQSRTAKSRSFEYAARRGARHLASATESVDPSLAMSWALDDTLSLR